jgi:hypothetical protein
MKEIITIRQNSVIFHPYGSSTGKLLDSLPRNDAVAELCSDEFKVAWLTPLIR